MARILTSSLLPTLICVVTLDPSALCSVDLVELADF
jgi:hypothetical protein